jgi:hypothetical protein
LATSAAAFHALTLAADRKTRGGNKWCKVSKAGLVALLLDHGAVLRALKAEGIETQDAPDTAGDADASEEGDEA